MPDDSSDPGIRFTTKELLEDIRRQVTAINSNLLGKADLSTVVQMNLQLEDITRRQIETAQRLALLESAGAGPDHNRRITALEQSDAVYQATVKDRKYLYGALVTLISVLVGVAGLLLTLK